MYYYIMYWNSVAYFRWGEISDGGNHICNVIFMKKKKPRKRDGKKSKRIKITYTAERSLSKSVRIYALCRYYI